MRRAVFVGVVGLVIAAAYAANTLSYSDWNPTSLIRFGEGVHGHVDYAHRWLGEDVIFTKRAGHDGKFFFVQAMDPFYLQPEEHAVHLDRPAYRAQRMLYPLLASAGGLLAPMGIAWGLIVVNVLAIGLGTLATARLAQDLGSSPWLGLAFTFNPGILHEMYIDGSGVLATAALMAGILFARRRRPWLSGGLLVASVLSRETMILAVLGLALFEWRRGKQLAWPIVVPPTVATGVWWVYLRLRVPDNVTQDLQALDLPFAGFIRAMTGWIGQPDKEVDIMVAILILLIAAYVVYRAWKTPTALNHAAAGIAVLAFVMSEPVWPYLDATRALSPVLTAFVLMVLTKEERAARVGGTTELVERVSVG